MRKDRLLVVSALILTFGCFSCASFMYHQSINTSKEAAQKELLFLKAQKCLLDNWSKANTPASNKNKLSGIHLQNTSTQKTSKSVPTDSSFTTLKHYKKFSYTCKSFNYRSYFGFFELISNKQTPHVEILEL